MAILLSPLKPKYKFFQKNVPLSEFYILFTVS